MVIASDRVTTFLPVWARIVSRCKPVSLEIWRRLVPWDLSLAASSRRFGSAKLATVFLSTPFGQEEYRIHLWGSLSMAEDLTVYGVDPARWAERWGLEPVSYPCDVCGALKTSSVPFVRGTLRGLYSPPCACGDQARTPYCMVRDYRVGDLLDGSLAE